MEVKDPKFWDLQLIIFMAIKKWFELKSAVAVANKDCCHNIVHCFLLVSPYCLFLVLSRVYYQFFSQCQSDEIERIIEGNDEKHKK